MNITGMMEAIPVMLETGVSLLFSGYHGVGKSQGVRQAIEGAGIGKVWDFRLGQMADVGDLSGLLDITNSDKYCEFKIPKRIYDVIQYCKDNPDKYGVLFFDELNRCQKDLISPIFQIALDNELNGLKFPDNMRSIFAQNPPTDDYGGVIDFSDKAFQDRFCQIKLEPSVDEWLDYANKIKLDPSIIGFIEENREMLTTKLADYKLEITPSPRSWVLVDQIKKKCLNEAVFKELAIGMLGTETAVCYFEYAAKKYKSLTALDILDNFKTHKDIIEKYSSDENNREDLLSNVCNQIKRELEPLDKMPKKWEKNLVNFILTIPKGLGYGFTTDLMCSYEAFSTTDSDPEKGLSENKALIDHMVAWRAEIKKTSKNDESSNEVAKEV